MIKKLGSLSLGWLIYLVCFLPIQSTAAQRNLHDFNWNALAQAILSEHNLIKGDWLFKNAWSSWPCDGKYRFVTSAQTYLEQINFVPQGEAIIVEATMRDPYIGVKGGYRSPISACIIASGWLGLSADSAYTKGTLTFDQGGTVETVNVKITETRLNRLHFGSGIPDWFEGFVTSMVNAAFRATWSSFLGDWINKRLTEEAKKITP